MKKKKQLRADSNQLAREGNDKKKKNNRIRRAGKKKKSNGGGCCVEEYNKLFDIGTMGLVITVHASR